MTSVPTYSHDQRFFVKTQRRHEVHVLLAHLPRYVEHLQQYPHSLLARLLGTRRRGGGGVRGGERGAGLKLQSDWGGRILGRGPTGPCRDWRVWPCFRLGWDFIQAMSVVLETPRCRRRPIEKGLWGWNLEGQAQVLGGS